MRVLLLLWLSACWRPAVVTFPRDTSVDTDTDTPAEQSPLRPDGSAAP